MTGWKQEWNSAGKILNPAASYSAPRACDEVIWAPNDLGNRTSFSSASFRTHGFYPGPAPLCGWRFIWQMIHGPGISSILGSTAPCCGLVGPLFKDFGPATHSLALVTSWNCDAKLNGFLYLPQSLCMQKHHVWCYQVLLPAWDRACPTLDQSCVDPEQTLS